MMMVLKYFSVFQRWGQSSQVCLFFWNEKKIYIQLNSNSCFQTRHVKWVVENPRMLVEMYKQKPVKAIIEQVRDASTLRAFLLPDFYYITMMLSGVKVAKFLFSLCCSSLTAFFFFI